MSAKAGTLLKCGCRILAGGRGINWCPLHLTAPRLFEALTNLESMAALIHKTQSSGLVVTPDMFEALVDRCMVAGVVLSEARPKIS